MDSNNIPVRVKGIDEAAVPSNRQSNHKGGRGLVGKLRKNWKKVGLVLLLAGVIALAYGYIHTRNQLSELSNPKTATKSQTDQLVDKIGKLVELPSGETPTTATVNDASKLKNQTFFKNAQDGDKVLIYSKASQAILYRPSTNKVIQYSPVNFNGTGQ